MAWYAAGTIAVTNGSAAVVGTGTSFVDNVKAGDALRGPDERLYQIASVNSATSLTLTRNYAGASAAGQTYEILSTQDALAVLAREAAALIQDYQDIADNAGQGMFGDGSAATPGVRFANDLDTGMWRPSTNTIAWATGGLERLRVSAGGLVGIGTAVPSQRLEVDGHIALTRGTYDKKLFLGSSTNYYYTVRASGNDLQIAEADDNAKVRLHIAYPSGNVGISTTNPLARHHVNQQSTSGVLAPTLGLVPAGGATSVQAIGNAYGLVTGIHSSGSVWMQSMSVAGTSAAYDLVMQPSGGSLLVGRTAPDSNASRVAINNVNDAEYSAGTLGLYSNDGTYSAVFFNARGTPAANAGVALILRAHSITGRSINAGGTVNASGADYAEYMPKAAGCGTIGKGDICGVDVDGKLTQSWAASRSFVIKSTYPSLVGGDTWAIDLDPRPESPAPLGPAPRAPIAPEPFTESMPTQHDGEEQEAFLHRLAEYYARANAAAEAAVTYQQQADAFADQSAVWESSSATYAADLAAYEAALAAWQAELEAARVKVDRIAFSGQVPANLTGAFSVGDYVVAAEGADDTITAIAVSRASFFASPDHQANRIGKVWAIREGRAWIDVQHG